MRIVQVCPYDIDRPGGVQGHIASLAAALRGRGHEVLVVAPGPGPDDAGDEPGLADFHAGAQRAIAAGGDRYEVSYMTARARRTAGARLSAFRPDIAHFHTPWTPFMAVQLFAQLECARVATFHDVPPGGLYGAVLKRLFPLMARGFLNRLDGAIAVSDAPLRHLKPGRRGVAPVVIPPAIDLAPFFAVERRKRRADAPFRVLFIGRLEPRKGILVLLDAWSRIEGAAFELTVAGAGKCRDAVVAAQEKHARRNPVHLRQAQNPRAAAALMAGADLLVAPSVYEESFGLVVVEALAAGLGVVASENRGYGAILTGDGRAGLVPPGDPQALAQAIMAARGRAPLTAWGRAHARQFDIARTVATIEGVYETARARHAGKSMAPATPGSRNHV